jgi:hypothetical protein
MKQIPASESMKFPAFYATLKLISVFTKALHKTFGVWHEIEFNIKIESVVIVNKLIYIEHNEIKFKLI